MSFLASYRSTCYDCGGPINQGDLIRHVYDQTGTNVVGYAHVICPDPEPSAVDLAPGETPCPSCHLVHRGECW